MKPKFWPRFYLVGSILAIIGSYFAAIYRGAQLFTPNWTFVAFAFIALCLFPLWAMIYCQRKGVEKFRKPSLDRHPFARFSDMLQALRVMLVGSILNLIGLLAALPKSDHQGVMIFWSYIAGTAGLIIGERLIYLIYAKRIV